MLVADRSWLAGMPRSPARNKSVTRCVTRNGVHWGGFRAVLMTAASRLLLVGAG